MAKTISTRLTHAVAYTAALDNPLTITSTGGILAASGGYGLSLGGGVVWAVGQQGTISAAGAIGVTLATGNLTNTGLIEGASFGVAFGGAGTVVNAGTIAGGTDAVSFAAGAADLVVADPGAVFTGTVHGGNTVSGGTVASTLDFASGAALGTFSGLGAHYPASTRYSIAAAASWRENGSNTLAAGATMSVLGSLNLAGTMTSYGVLVNTGYIAESFVLAAHGGSVTNSGVISSANAIVLDVTNATVTNQSGGTLSGTSGVRLHNGATLVNAATVYGRTDGAYSFGSGTIVNEHGGSISGGLLGVYLFSGAGVVNAGYLGGGFQYGVQAQGGATIVNQAGGTIAGPQAVVEGAGARMLNQGLVTGSSYGEYDRGGTITNTASAIIEGGVTGIVGYGLIIDAGTISGGTGYALQLAAGRTSQLVADPGANFIGTVSGGGRYGTLELAAGIGTLGGFGSTVFGLRADHARCGRAMVAGGLGLGLGGGETISGFAAGSTIELTGTAESYVAFAGGVLTLSGGTTLDLPGVAHVGVTNGGQHVHHRVFRDRNEDRGRVRAGAGGGAARGRPRADGAGRLAPVRWIGHRRTDLARHPRPYDVMPVRVRAGAFGGEACRCATWCCRRTTRCSWTGISFRSGYLINGQSIVQETREGVTYWHVELDRHDVILAEDLPARAISTPATVRVRGRGGVPDAGFCSRAVWAAEGCAPILTDPADADAAGAAFAAAGAGAAACGRGAAARSA